MLTFFPWKSSSSSECCKLRWRTLVVLRNLIRFVHLITLRYWGAHHSIIAQEALDNYYCPPRPFRGAPLTRHSKSVTSSSPVVLGWRQRDRFTAALSKTCTGVVVFLLLFRSCYFFQLQCVFPLLSLQAYTTSQRERECVIRCFLCLAFEFFFLLLILLTPRIKRFTPSPWGSPNGQA